MLIEPLHNSAKGIWDLIIVAQIRSPKTELKEEYITETSMWLVSSGDEMDRKASLQRKQCLETNIKTQYEPAELNHTSGQSE